MKASAAALLILALSVRAAQPSSVNPGSEGVRRREFLKAVRAYIKSRTDLGIFRQSDDVLQREWELRLVHVRRDRVGVEASGDYHTCVDFKDVDGESNVDVDFFGRAGKDGWVVTQNLVHRVDDKTRFLYNENGARVPVE